MAYIVMEEFERHTISVSMPSILTEHTARKVDVGAQEPTFTDGSDSLAA